LRGLHFPVATTDTLMPEGPHRVTLPPTARKLGRVVHDAGAAGADAAVAVGTAWCTVSQGVPRALGAHAVARRRPDALAGVLAGSSAWRDGLAADAAFADVPAAELPAIPARHVIGARDACRRAAVVIAQIPVVARLASLEDPVAARRVGGDQDVGVVA